MLQEKSIIDAVGDPQGGSPNLLLYMGQGSGGGYVPEPYDDGRSSPWFYHIMLRRNIAPTLSEFSTSTLDQTLFLTLILN